MGIPQTNPIDIASTPPRIGQSLLEAWRHRELLLLLARRDLSVRYKQTALGIGWVLLQPALVMVVFSVVFGRLAGVPSDGLPYPLFVLCGLIPWQLFAYALTQSSNSLLDNERLVTKVYFPRILLPLAAALAGVVDFAVAFVLLLAVCVAYGSPPSAGILLVPVLAALILCAALAAGLWLAALNAEYRDVRHTVPFLTQLGLFVSPVAYPSSLIPLDWRWLYGLNPMVPIIDALRWALAGGPPPQPSIALGSAAVTLTVLALAVAFFERRQRLFADTL